MGGGLCILTPGSSYPESLWAGDVARFAALFSTDLAFCPWDSADLRDFDLILPLLAWDYPKRANEWFDALDRWDAQCLPIANAVETLRWNSDKSYLLQLATAGVPVVPTVSVSALHDEALAEARAAFGCDTLIAKPAISAGAMRTHRLGPNDPVPADSLGLPMLVQPLLPAIASEGEYSLFYFDGRFSHAIVKRPTDGDFRVQPQFGGQIESVAPPRDALAVAKVALNACPAPPLYARVDMLRDEAGGLRLMELELIEPQLFLDRAADNGAAFVEAVRRSIA